MKTYNDNTRPELNGMQYETITQCGLTFQVFTAYITPCDAMGQRTGDVETVHLLGCEISEKNGLPYYYDDYLFNSYYQALRAAQS